MLWQRLMRFADLSLVCNSDELQHLNQHNLNSLKYLTNPPALSQEEASVVGGYHRVKVTTDAGVCAWAYAYGSGIDVLTPIPSGNWLDQTSTAIHE